MQKYVSWFNLMTYDLHGMWDHDNTWTGPWLKGHTDIKEIDEGLDLLWRNNIKPENVVFGMAFYGRSFTMADPNCHEPNGVCRFSTGGMPGSCSNTVGVLTYQEITARNTTLDVQTYYNAETTVKYNVFNGNQWISYDDAQSWYDKKAFVSNRCLSGIMVWALDQDNATFDAYEGLMGDTSLLQLEGGGLSDDEKAALADQFAAYTGQNCFVTPRCTDGSAKQQGPDQVCPGGFQSVSTAHTPKQAPGHDYFGECSEGWYRHICCPKNAMPKNCAWNGAPERSAFGCDGQCGSTQLKLNEDSALDAKGKGSCYTGTRALCCDSTAIVSDCYWSPCQGPLAPGSNPQCDSGYTFEAYKLDKPDGSRWCSDTYVSPVGGKKGSPLHDRFKSALCCPEKQAFSNCHWSNDPQREDGLATRDPEPVCLPQQCGKGKIKLADALDPPVSPMVDPSQRYPISCDSVSIPPGLDMHFPLCCEVQSKYNKKWPVDPEKLYEIYYNDPEKSDVLWQYSDEVTNNDRDDTRSDAEDGTDAFGFLMLDGPEGSIDNSFATTQTVIRRDAKIPNIKRSLVTNNQTVLDEVFENSEEVICVYCNSPAGSPECERIWIDGAEDTIIRLPDHVGEGPFARIVSMTLAEDTKLPDHHLEHRAAGGIHANPVYEVKIDYNFLAITPKRADQPVMLRVDYTNLLGYWDEVTAADPSKMKRDENGKTMPDWHSRVRRAVIRDATLRKRSEPINITAPMDPVFSGSSDVADENGVEKRWWGVIGAWIKKLTTVEKSELGVIPLGWSDSINLFRAQWGCPGQKFSANLRMDLEAEIQMDATYAYYLSGTFIPPSKPEVYAYLGMEPTAYVGLRMVGNAVMQTTTGRKKIIDTLAYPGLAVKGIAAVGPTLDVYGEIRGKITLHGEASAGAQVNFGKAEVYWPTDEDASKQYQKLIGLDSKSDVPAPNTIAPTFEAGVRLDAGLDVIVTPEASIGVKIGGGSLVGGVTIMDAQLTGYVTGDLSFQASGDADLSAGKFRYSYGVYVFYNLGYKVTATIVGIVNWATGPIQAYTPSKIINVYGPVSGEISLTKRALDGFLLDGDTDWHSSNGTTSLLSRADEEGDVTPNDPEFTQNLQCPPGSSGDVKIPELRCKFMNNLDSYSSQYQPLPPFSSQEQLHQGGYNPRC
jgi:chitinase